MILGQLFRASRAILLSAVALSLASPCLGQSSRVGGDLVGTVSDSSGAVVPGAPVVIQNLQTNQSRTVSTDDQGLFRSGELPVGTYEIRVERPGFAPYRRTGIALSLGQTLRLDVVLNPASASTQVTVTAQPSALDISQTSMVSSVDQERIEELPVRSRNYLDFVLLAPGVSSAPAPAPAGGSTPLAGSGFTFGGLRSRSNNVSIDGLDNNDEFTGSSRTEISPEIVQEFQVVNNGLSAESGGASGGSINVITRSGTNMIHGDAFLFAQDSALNARDPFEIESGKPSFRRFRAGFALGGPLVKDRTFYYVAAEQEHNRGQIGSDIAPDAAAAINSFLSTGALPAFPVRQITTAFSPTARAETEIAGKLNHQLRKDTLLMLRYAFTNNKEAGDAFNNSGLMDPSMRGSSWISDNSLSGSLTTLTKSQAISDWRFQVATRRALLGTNHAAGPEIDIAGVAAFGRAYSGNSARRENHYQADYAYTRSRGKHAWKAGATINRVRLRADVPDGFGGAYRFGSLADFLRGRADQFRQAFGSAGVNFPVTSFGVFLQDHWSLFRQLTVDVGARYDFERLPSGFNRDADNFSPRIGLAWSPSSRVVFRAGYGIFFDRYVLANLTRAIERDGSLIFEQVADGASAATLFAGAAGGSLGGPLSGIAASIFRPDPGLATPYSEQASAGGEYLLAPNMTLRFDYLFVRGIHLPQTVNVNLLPPAILGPGNAAALGIRNPALQQLGRPVFSAQRLNPQFNDIYQLRDSSSSTYNGASLTLSRQMNEDLEFSASYTLSKTVDDASDFDEQPRNPFDGAAERARSRQDQPQRFVFNALWELPIGDEENSDPKSRRNRGWATRAFSHIEVAPIFTAASGQPANPLTGLDSNRTHAFPLSSRPLGFARNSLRMPRTAALDLRVLKYFPFGPSRHLDVVAEVFNLANRANVVQINPVFGSGAAPSADFGERIEGLGARQVQFSLDYEF
jgi:hypothetical protein